MTPLLHDQADELRQLVLRTAIRDRAADTPAPPLIVFAGAKGGVGGTTAAVNAAVTLARQGRRTVLVDADFHHPHATTLCQLNERETVADVLGGLRTVHEVLQRGPAGLQVLPGAWGAATAAPCGPLAQQRILAELRRLGPHADLIVLDAGSSADAAARRFWEAADLLVLVTTDEPTAIMDCYAAIKILTAQEYAGQIRIFVNQVDAAGARQVVERINAVCQRFLGVAVAGAGSAPHDVAVAAAAQAERPVALHQPESPASLAIERLADHVQITIEAWRVLQRQAQAA